jgi:hypothetical protein
LSINFASSYIDPGTGGYLASSFGSVILTYLAIGLAAIGTFLATYFFKPLKNFILKNKRILAVILIILTIALFSFFHITKNKSNANLSGAYVYNSSEMYPAYYLYEGKLIDERGNILHNWSSINLGVIDKNGDYYAQEYSESKKWGKYTWNDSVVWELDFPIHHEILLTPQDTIITFTKEVHKYNGRKVEFDVILELNKNGEILSRWSTWDNLDYLKQFHKPLELDSPYENDLSEDNWKNTSIWGGNYDYYHLNSISLVPNNSLQGIHPAFNPGNWIISFRHGSMIFILDKDTKEILWRAIYDQIEDNLEGPHTPIMTSKGNIIIFDNGRYREWSRIISINPINLNITWEYKNKDFFSLSQSSVQLLPNYNLLVTEAEKGHVFELTPEKEIVWEFYNPNQQINRSGIKKDEIRQQIYRMAAYDKSFIDSLIMENN